MKSRLKPDTKLITLKELIIYALIGALMFALQVAMAPLPNIEPVSIIILVSSRSVGYKSLYSTYIFILLVGLLHGFGIWWISYLYIWPIWTSICIIFRKNQSAFVWSLISAAFGLSFGTLCSIPIFITGGIGAWISYCISNIPFDILHCFGNFFICLILFKPLDSILKKLTKNL